jgi:hypothetical protein
MRSLNRVLYYGSGIRCRLLAIEVTGAKLCSVSNFLSMATGSRSRDGCWTCMNLDILCHGYSEKPGWMDGGPRQEGKSSTAKAKDHLF